jgi:hypothetical protein
MRLILSYVHAAQFPEQQEIDRHFGLPIAFSSRLTPIVWSENGASNPHNQCHMSSIFECVGPLGPMRCRIVPVIIPRRFRTYRHLYTMLSQTSFFFGH